MSGRVLVVGSINVDTTSEVAALPGAGETVVAQRTRVSLGGKGANQAVAAHRFGAAATLVARVGADASGAFALAELRRLGLGTHELESIGGETTGTAAITVDAAGENTVVVAGGANRLPDAGSARAALARFAAAPDTAAGVVLVQGELPPEVDDAVAADAARAGIRFVVNLAPVVALAASSLALADPLVVNEPEARALGLAPGDPSPAGWLAAAAAGVGPLARSIVVTLGPAGAVAAWQEPTGEGTAVVTAAVPAPAAHAVDTTGAGDCFVGTLAAALAEGMPMRRAIELAVVAGACSVEASGTVDSYPDRATVLARAAGRRDR